MANRDRDGRKSRAPLSVRLAAEGTRVIVLKGEAPHIAGTISAVRPETHLRAYVVTCDDGLVVYASAYELAREDDASCKPLGIRPEY